MRQLKELYESVKELVATSPELRELLTPDSKVTKAMVKAGKFLYRTKTFEYTGKVSTLAAYSACIKLNDIDMDLDDAIRLVCDVTRGKMLDATLELYIINITDTVPVVTTPTVESK